MLNTEQASEQVNGHRVTISDNDDSSVALFVDGLYIWQLSQCYLGEGASCRPCQ